MKDRLRDLNTKNTDRGGKGTFNPLQQDFFSNSTAGPGRLISSPVFMWSKVLYQAKIRQCVSSHKGWDAHDDKLGPGAKHTV